MMETKSRKPMSCDTFVCLHPGTVDNVVIFGKNSDRPSEEVQEIVYFPRRSYKGNSKVECTYIEIDQIAETAAIILSKPSWMWGGEMGANSHGVCIGNEAVWGKVDAENEKQLLGMDLLRLGLERGKSAREALDVIIGLLQLHGQGGPCSQTMSNLTYHNSYLIVDSKEAWVLETIGKMWAAEKIESRYRNISNSLSIGTKIDLMSDGLMNEAEKLGFWKSSTEFHFAKAFDYGGGGERFHEGKRLLAKYSANNNFDVTSMMSILRNEDSGINMGGYEDGFATTSSQVSVLHKTEKGLSCHWFTGTPDPLNSVFKPFTFLEEIETSVTEFTATPEDQRVSKGDFSHPLYKVHKVSYEKIRRDKEMKKCMNDLESSLLEKWKDLSLKSDTLSSNEKDILSKIFNKSVVEEIKLYS